MTVLHTECWACSQLNNTWNTAIFWLHHLTWEKIPGSFRFSILQATESWVVTGYEANFTQHLGLFFFKMSFMIVHACLHSFVLHDCFDGSTQQLSPCGSFAEEIATVWSVCKWWCTISIHGVISCMNSTTLYKESSYYMLTWWVNIRCRSLLHWNLTYTAILVASSSCMVTHKFLSGS